MSDVTDADREKAAALTGCVLADAEAKYGPPFCASHDEDGNPPWERCRWAPVAAALAEERDRARAPFLALAEWLETDTTNDLIDDPTYVAGLIRRAVETTE